MHGLNSLKYYSVIYLLRKRLAPSASFRTA